VAPVVGGLLASSRLMIINTTSAAALVAGQSMLGFSAEDRPDALFLMVILTGIIAVAMGLLGLGRAVRFVSLSVMTGFITGIAIALTSPSYPRSAASPRPAAASPPGPSTWSGTWTR